MEKRKLLLVAISVGVFLVITIGAAIVLAPKSPAASYGAPVSRYVPDGQTGITVPPPALYTDSPERENAESTRPASLDAVDLVRKPGEVPGLQPSPEGSSRQDFYVNGADGGTVISVRRPSSAAVPESAPAGKAAATPASRPAPAAPKPAAQDATSGKKPAAAAKPAVQKKAQDDYWVQTGAFSTLAKAEGVKETLAIKGITSLIENRDVNGNTLFRVRVGPYTSQNEANYWLSLIKSINGFEESQVRQTRRY